MRSLDHGDEKHIVEDLVDHSIIADPDPMWVIRPSNRLGADWAWRVGEAIDCREDPGAVRPGCEPGEFVGRGGLESQRPVSGGAFRAPKMFARARLLGRAIRGHTQDRCLTTLGVGSTDGALLGDDLLKHAYEIP